MKKKLIIAAVAVLPLFAAVLEPAEARFPTKKEVDKRKAEASAKRQAEAEERRKKEKAFFNEVKNEGAPLYPAESSKLGEHGGKLFGLSGFRAVRAAEIIKSVVKILKAGGYPCESVSRFSYYDNGDSVSITCESDSQYPRSYGLEDIKEGFGLSICTGWECKELVENW